MKVEDEFAEELFRLCTELHSQQAQWGDPRHDDFKWITLLTEETGKAAQACMRNHPWYAYSELLQAAAVALHHARAIRLRMGDEPVEPHF